MIFKNRQAAGKLLAKRLKKYKDKSGAIVLGIPRGGVLVASEIAKELNLPLDIIITRKIGAPYQKELALGAIDPDGEAVWDQDLIEQLKVDDDQMRQIIQEELSELERREREYRTGKPALNVSGKIAILVDDGMATGATTLAAIRYLKRHGAKKIVLSLPVSSQSALDRVKSEVDQVEVIYTPEDLLAVGQYYQDFHPVSDQEVREILLRRSADQDDIKD